jgi:hypothetical protein
MTRRRESTSDLIAKGTRREGPTAVKPKKPKHSFSKRGWWD